MKLSDLKPNDVPEGFSAIACVATGHISAKDNAVLGRVPAYLALSHDYGYIIPTAPLDDNRELRSYGVSDELLALLDKLHELRIFYVNLDCDGPVFDDLPLFDW